MTPLQSLAISDDERRRVQRVGEIAAMGPSALGELLAQLVDPSWAVRRAVVSALASLGDAAVAPLCAILATDRGNEARLAAVVDALVASRADVDDAVLALAASDVPATVCDAAQILGRRKSARAVPTLARLTTAEDENVALAAIEALGRIGSEEAIVPLIAAVESRTFFRTFPAIDVLGRSTSPRVVAPLLAMLGEPLYAIEAARALGRIGDPTAVPALTALLEKPSEALVRVAASALVEIHDRQIERFGAPRDGSAPIDGAPPARATRRIVQCLPNADSKERAHLVRVLGWIGDASAVAALIDMLDADVTTAQAAADALGRLGRAAQAPLLEALRGGGSERRILLLPLVAKARDAAGPIVECLRDPNPAVRSLACDALARVGDASVVPELFALLADADARVAQSAIAAIQSLGSAETERLALAAARSADPRIRRSGLRIIAYFGYAAATDVVIEASVDGDERIRDAALFGLPFLDDPRATDAMLKASSHPSPRTRAAAMRAMGQATRAPSTLAALRTGLHDADAWVRYFACQALSRLEDDRAADTIALLLSDPAGQVRVAAIEALAHLRGARALDALHRAAASDDTDVARAALLGLGIVKDASSLALLREALQNPDAATRLVAVSALAGYPNPDIARDLGTALADADEGVRNAALALLASRPGPEATLELVAHLGDRPIQSRLVAALAQPADGRVAVLTDALRRADGETAPLLVSALARMKRSDASLALEDAFTTEDPLVRRAIAPALARQASVSARARALLAHAAAHDTDDEVRRMSAAAERG